MKKTLEMQIYSYPPNIINRLADMVKEYQDYWFHIKASLVGMLLGLPTCLIAGLVCQLLP